MLHYRTEGFHGYGIKYSPFFDNRVAVAASANFGLVGNGRLYVLGLTPGGIVGEKWFDTNDGLFDLAWSELHENQIAAASGDGSIKLFDIALNEFPIQAWNEHQREVFCVHWNLVEKSTFCSSSWDGTVKIWAPGQPRSLSTFMTGSCTYSAQFSPHHPNLVSAVSSDSQMRVFDVRSPLPAGGISKPQIQVPVSPNAPAELLTHDWNKYRDMTVAVGGVDRVVRVYDLRQPAVPLSELRGHGYAIKKLAWSVHWSGVLASAGYDMTVRFWNDNSSTAPFGAGQTIAPKAGPGTVERGEMLGVMDRHTEFIPGLDWCMFGGEGWIASAGWDESVWIFDAKQFMRGIR